MYNAPNMFCRCGLVADRRHLEGPADAPWRTLANSRGLDCNVPDAEMSDLPAVDDNPATIETPFEKEKSSEVAAREDWYFVEGTELHYFPDEILEDDYNELDQILRDHPDVDTLVLTSNGGYFSYAMDIVQVVFDYQLNTKADIMCYSACTFILLAGGTVINPWRSSRVSSVVLGSGRY